MIVALAAIAATPAMGEEYPAEFSDDFVRLTTSGVTFEHSVEGSTACTLYQNQTQGETSANIAWVHNFPYWTRFNCSGGKTLDAAMAFAVWYDDVLGEYIVRLGAGVYKSPWGTWEQVSEDFGIWHNGSGSTPSTIVFDDTFLGTDHSEHLGAEISLTGTFTAKGMGGALLTVSH